MIDSTYSRALTPFTLGKVFGECRRKIRCSLDDLRSAQSHIKQQHFLNSPFTPILAITMGSVTQVKHYPCSNDAYRLWRTEPIHSYEFDCENSWLGVINCADISIRKVLTVHRFFHTTAVLPLHMEDYFEEISHLS